MTKVLGTFHTDAGEEFAIADGYNDGEYETVVILVENTTGDLVGGQVAHKHNVKHGTENNQFSTP